MAEIKKRGRPAKPKEIEVDETTGEVVEEAGKQIVKAKSTAAKKTTSPSWDIEFHADGKKEEISQILGNCLRWYKMEKVQSIDELRERVEAFFVSCFERGEVPTWEKLCLATGYHRITCWEWATGQTTSQLGSEAGNILKKAKDFLATFESEMVTNGKINPVVYIFRAKNYFGMKDQQEYVLTPKQPLGDMEDPATMAQKYQAALPGDSGDFGEV